MLKINDIITYPNFVDFLLNLIDHKPTKKLETTTPSRFTTQYDVKCPIGNQEDNFSENKYANTFASGSISRGIIAIA